MLQTTKDKWRSRCVKMLAWEGSTKSQVRFIESVCEQWDNEHIPTRDQLRLLKVFWDRLERHTHPALAELRNDWVDAT